MQIADMESAELNA